MYLPENATAPPSIHPPWEGRDPDEVRADAADSVRAAVLGLQIGEAICVKRTDEAMFIFDYATDAD